MKNKLIISLIMLFALAVPSAFSFTVEVLDTDPAPIEAGEYADVTVRFTNDNVASDDVKEEVTFSVERNDFILPVSTTGDNINKVFSGESFSRTFRILFSEELEQGNVSIPFIVEGKDFRERHDISVFIQDAQTNPELFVGQIETTPDELLPDTEDNKLVLTLQNLGEKDAELVSAELMFDTDMVKQSFSYSLIDSVAEISAGSEAELEFTIDLEENARGVIDADLKLRYRAERSVGNTYETFDEIIPVKIPLSDAPLLVVESVELIDSFEAGTTENKFRVTIRNDGTDAAEEVRIRAAPDISYPFIFELLTMYVTSEIDVGETATVEFKTEVTGDAEQRDYSMTVVLESLVGETRYSREDEITVAVQGSSDPGVGTIGRLIIGVIIVFSIIIGISLYRSNRKKNRK